MMRKRLWTFVARGFSGDKAQLVPILEAGLKHQGFAFVDVIAPCVTFNDHEGSTKSYAYTRENNVEVVQADFVPQTMEQVLGESLSVAGPFSRRRGRMISASRLTSTLPSLDGSRLAGARVLLSSW